MILVLGRVERRVLRIIEHGDVCDDDRLRTTGVGKEASREEGHTWKYNENGMRVAEEGAAATTRRTRAET